MTQRVVVIWGAIRKARYRWWIGATDLAPHKSPTTAGQPPDKNLIIIPDKDVNQTLTESTQESIPTTCPNNYVISKQVSIQVILLAL